MIFECSCGFRPFLHNLQPVQWTTKVRNKGPKDIMAVEDMNGEVRFSTHLPYPNNLSRTLLDPLESLLQLMLRWDPVQRGGALHHESRQPQCFSVLEEILSMKVVHILNMASTQVHSFLLSPDEGLHSLQQRIEAETGIQHLHQELLQETGRLCRLPAQARPPSRLGRSVPQAENIEPDGTLTSAPSAYDTKDCPNVFAPLQF
ncbi:hypothetical protein AALO_G00228560 [Alosa alosa]|uniref:Uncharacterized protein n=1 Tax=Alosa alosa TaxID=278164 RepID=A0AAV6FTQ3_9TELE|nr:hypothetical protein AALO_G00228560 [Alosa alosa]